MRLQACSALITGASAGIGRELARQLATRASRLVLAARREDRLRELATELTRANPALQVEVHRADLSNLENTRQLASTLSGINFLVNNAGLGDYGPFVDADPARVEKQIQVNILALTILTRALLPSMLAQRRGAVLNVSSSASFLPIAGFAVYAASKAYVTSFSEALRAETRGTGVSVTALCPGPVKTEFDEVARRKQAPARHAPSFVYVSGENVAALALRAVERDKPLVIPGASMKVGMAFTRVLPLSVLRAAARWTQR